MSQELDNYILANYANETVTEIANKFGVQRATVRRHAQKLGLSKQVKYVNRGEQYVVIPDSRLQGLYSVTENGLVFNNSTQCLLSSKLNHNGYPMVTFQVDNNKVYLLLHRIVALAFIPNPQQLPVVNHLDGDKTNYTIANLEWTDAKGNAVHASQSGLLLGNTGVNNHRTLLTDDEVRAIRQDHKMGMRQVDIVNKYPNATRSSVQKILHGVNRKNII